MRDASFHSSVLSEFRQRLVTQEKTRILLERILARCLEKGLLKGAGKQWTGSTRVLAAIRLMNRVELVGETMRRALDDLASVAPAWLLAQMKPEWGERYSSKMDTHRIRQSEDKLQTLALTISSDGYDLLQAVYENETTCAIRSLSSIETLRRIWVQQ